MRVIIIGNSPVKSFKKDYQFKKGDYLIACDNGIAEATSYEVDLAIGDFDSGGSNLISYALSNQVYPAIKDQTDLELALLQVEKLANVSEILIYDASGGRLDHYLINLKLIAKYQNKYHCKIKLITEKEEITYLTIGDYLIPNQNYQYLSLINFDKVSLLLDGLKYNLPKTLLLDENTLTISNEFVKDEARITIYSGATYLILTK